MKHSLKVRRNARTCPVVRGVGQVLQDVFEFELDTSKIHYINRWRLFKTKNCQSTFWSFDKVKDCGKDRTA
jgi:hypothetical protein